MAGLNQWSTTPASNASVGSINWAEGQSPSTVNNSARQLMADVAKAVDGTTVLTGWHVVDDGFTLYNTADATKIVKFNASGLSAGVTRTFSFPNASGTLATSADLAGFQTQDAYLDALTLGSGGFNLINGTLTASVGSSALTVAVKTKAGGDPSSSDPVYVSFRNVTVATGDYAVLAITAATSIVISSGSTMGASSGTAFGLWLVGFNDGGTFRLGLINCLSGTNIYPLGGFPIKSSTAEGGAGAADSAHVFYTGSAVTSKAYTVIARMTWESGLTTAGTWDAVPTRIQLHQLGNKLPGGVVAVSENETGAVASGTTVMFNDDTIPQNTEGFQVMSQAHTASSAANVLEIEAKSGYDYVGAGTTHTAFIALFRDSVADALGLAGSGRANGYTGNTVVKHTRLAGSTSAQTFKTRIGSDTAGTMTFNGAAAARRFGGVVNSYMRVKEYVA